MASKRRIRSGTSPVKGTRDNVRRGMTRAAEAEGMDRRMLS